MNDGRRQRGLPLFAFAGATIVAIFLLVPSGDLEDTYRQIFGIYLLNTLKAAIVFVHGVLALRIMWRIEAKGRQGILLFAWSYFAVQHLAFGFGGLLVALFNQGYIYQNNFGNFPWEEVIGPLLLTHFVVMNVGVIGIWAAAASRGVSRTPNGEKRKLLSVHHFEWDRIAGICQISLAVQAVVSVLEYAIDRHILSPTIVYPIQIVAECSSATFLLWGLSWHNCRNKWLFITYAFCFTIAEIIRGGRGTFLLLFALFALGFLFSPGGRRLSLRRVAAAFPVVLMLVWAFTKAEDMRAEFSRGTPDNAEEAVARLGALEPGSSAQAPAQNDAGGAQMTSGFRIGSRLFELSAADVRLATPSSIPFWGWTDEDWSILWSGLVPLKLNSDSVAATSETAGVRYLQDYGWLIDTSEGGTSMPATLIGDAWRRFGWLGIVCGFFSLAWVLAVITSILAERNDTLTLLFTCALFVFTAFLYSGDWVSMIFLAPRRILIAMVYACMIYVLSGMRSNAFRRRNAGLTLKTSLPGY